MYEELIAFMRDYQGRHGKPPTMQEIKENVPSFGYRSSVRYALRSLVDRGVLAEVNEPGHARRYYAREEYTSKGLQNA